jgi:hypothetical protein
MARRTGPRCEICGEHSSRRLACPQCGRLAGPCCRPREVRGGYRGQWLCADCAEDPAADDGLSALSDPDYTSDYD